MPDVLSFLRMMVEVDWIRFKWHLVEKSGITVIFCFDLPNRKQYWVSNRNQDWFQFITEARQSFYEAQVWLVWSVRTLKCCRSTIFLIGISKCLCISLHELSTAESSSHMWLVCDYSKGDKRHEAVKWNSLILFWSVKSNYYSAAREYIKHETFIMRCNFVS